MSTSPRGVRPGRLRLWLALAVVAAALGFLLLRGLGDAALYFYNADEAVARHDELGERRFRLQGDVVDGSVRPTADGVAFQVTYGGATVDVHHQGDPPELFQPDIPVVLEGAFAEAGRVFRSDRMMVKHTAEYRAENPERVPADAP